MIEYRFEYCRKSTGSVFHSTWFAEDDAALMDDLKNNPECKATIQPGGEGWWTNLYWSRPTEQQPWKSFRPAPPEW